MKIEEYQKLFHTAPPEHLVKKGKVVCPVCLKNSPQVKQICTTFGLFPCVECILKQSKHKPFHPVTPERKMENLSPEEVLNGVHHGMEYNGPKSTKTWSEEKRETIKNLKKALR